MIYKRKSTFKLIYALTFYNPKNDKKILWRHSYQKGWALSKISDIWVRAGVVLSLNSVLVCTNDVGASIFENSIVSFKNRKCVIIFLLYDWRGFLCGASIKSCQPWKKISSPIELKENFHGSPITTAIWLQQGQKWFIFWNVF